MCVCFVGWRHNQEAGRHSPVAGTGTEKQAVSKGATCPLRCNGTKIPFCQFGQCLGSLTLLKLAKRDICPVTTGRLRSI